MKISFNPLIKMGRISFSKNEKAVYAINKDNEYKRYNSRKEAAKELGIPVNGIYACVNHKTHSSMGYVFVNAQDIEKQDENERIQAAVSQQNTEKKKVKNGIYAIDKEGNYTKFSSKKEASKALKIPSEIIHRAVKQDSLTDKRFIFVLAEDVEKTGENGESEPDLNKIKKLTKRFEYADGRTPIYAFDEKGQYTKFQSLMEAAEKLSVSQTTISKNLNNKPAYKNGYIYIKAEDIETFDEQGNTIIDKDKLYKLCETKRKENSNKSKNIALYRITQAGKYKRYQSISQAARDTGRSELYIKKHLDNKTVTKENQAFILAADVDIYDNAGFVKPNKQVLKNFYKDVFGEKE